MDRLLDPPGEAGHPRAMHRCPRASIALIATTGIRAVRSSCIERLPASAPFMSGSRRSIKITSGRCATASPMPSSARSPHPASGSRRRPGRPERASGSSRCRRRSGRGAWAYPPAMPIRVVLAEDHLIVREGASASPRSAVRRRDRGGVRRPRLPARRGGDGAAGRRHHGHPDAPGEHRRGDPGRGAAASNRSQRRRRRAQPIRHPELRPRAAGERQRGARVPPEGARAGARATRRRRSTRSRRAAR